MATLCPSIHSSALDNARLRLAFALDIVTQLYSTFKVGSRMSQESWDNCGSGNVGFLVFKYDSRDSWSKGAYI
ncbi:hypothetical protein FKW77_001732 [Venturia effusa]|uniref:Uncharacterized protein n=1 Tax=Venturia effusa TaxID=50376 RepID=A0A517LRF2_9PEZI|nr:hypothetical protein FKW77_001732 [Venturia effusa]